MADGDIPVTGLLSSASLHDSQVAIPLAIITASRVTNCYDLMDTAYDAPEIWEKSRALGHVPIIAAHPRSIDGGKAEIAAEAKRAQHLGTAAVVKAAGVAAPQQAPLTADRHSGLSHGGHGFSAGAERSGVSTTKRVPAAKPGSALVMVSTQSRDSTQSKPKAMSAVIAANHAGNGNR